MTRTPTHPVCFLFYSLFFLPPSQRIRHWEEEAAHLPHCGLRESVREDVAPASTPALALGGATFCLQLDVLRQEVHTQRRAAETPENTHRCPPPPPPAPRCVSAQGKHQRNVFICVPRGESRNGGQRSRPLARFQRNTNVVKRAV